MHDIDTEVARPSSAEDGIHVGPIHIDLAAYIMHDLAQLDDAFLEHAVGRRIGHHHRRQIVPVGIRFGAKVDDVDVALIVAFDHDHRQSRHDRTRRVGAVRRARDQADCAVALPLCFVPATDHKQAGIFALRARVRLERYGGKPCRLGQTLFEAVDQLLIARRLVERRKGVHARKAGPGDRNHLRGRVQLHGAGPKRNHRAI